MAKQSHVQPWDPGSTPSPDFIFAQRCRVLLSVKPCPRMPHLHLGPKELVSIGQLRPRQRAGGSSGFCSPSLSFSSRLSGMDWAIVWCRRCPHIEVKPGWGPTAWPVPGKMRRVQTCPSTGVQPFLGVAGPTSSESWPPHCARPAGFRSFSWF